jgi:hypothetical protein
MKDAGQWAEEKSGLEKKPKEEIKKKEEAK